MVRRLMPVLFCILLFNSSVAFPDTELKLWYGLLHAHTYYSDGSGTPEEAYKRAKSKGVNFFAVTPHNHNEAESFAKDRKDGILIATNQDLYNFPSKVTFKRKGKTKTEKSVIQAARDNTSSAYLPIYGQEFSSISAGNHINVFGVEEVIDIKKGEFHLLFDYLRTQEKNGNQSLVLQLNHPKFHDDLFYRGADQKKLNKMYNDYGFDDYGHDFSALVNASDRYINLIEMLSGPALKKTKPNNHTYKAHNNDYYYYLVQGFHISPTAGHDNHYKTWGDMTDARTGLWAKSLSNDAVMHGFRNNRTFATEDKDLSVKFSINKHMMGSVLEADAEVELTITVEVNDTSESNAGYEATLVYGTVEQQTRESLQKYVESDGVQETVSSDTNGSMLFNGYLVSGKPEFYYVSIETDDGDRAWSAPIWINHPRQTIDPVVENVFVWTKSSSSKVYHHDWCKWIKRIKSANKRSGATPPSGRQLHNCVKDEEGEGH